MQCDDAYLLDNLESARTALRYVSGKMLDDFRNDMLCQDAVIHLKKNCHKEGSHEFILTRLVVPQGGLEDGLQR